MTRTLFEIAVHLTLDTPPDNAADYTHAADMLAGVVYEVLATRESLTLLFKGSDFDDAHLECEIAEDTGVLTATAVLDIEAAKALQFTKPPLTKMFRDRLLAHGKVKLDKRLLDLPQPQASDIADEAASSGSSMSAHIESTS